MNCLIGVYRIIIKIIHDFSLFLPINPPIIRLPIGSRIIGGFIGRNKEKSCIILIIIL